MLVTLRYLSTNAFEQSIGDEFGIRQNTVSAIVKRVCDVFADLAGNFIHFPVGESETEMKRLFFEKYNLPFTIGCVDGTHIRIMVEKKSNLTCVCGKRECRECLAMPRMHATRMMLICGQYNKFKTCLLACILVCKLRKSRNCPVILDNSRFSLS